MSACLSRSLQSGIGGSGGLLTDEVPFGGGPVCGVAGGLQVSPWHGGADGGGFWLGHTAADARVVEVDRSSVSIPTSCWRVRKKASLPLADASTKAESLALWPLDTSSTTPSFHI